MRLARVGATHLRPKDASHGDEIMRVEEDYSREERDVALDEQKE